jgi:hypothetical protein
MPSTTLPTKSVVVPMNKNVHALVPKDRQIGPTFYNISSFPFYRHNIDSLVTGGARAARLVITAAFAFISTKHVHAASHVHLFFFDFLFYLFFSGVTTAASVAAATSTASSSGLGNQCSNLRRVFQEAGKDNGVIRFYLIVTGGGQKRKDLVGSDVRL